MLLSEGDETFNNTIKDAFGSFRPRIVDMALKKSLFNVLAETGYEDEAQCLELGSFGTRWIDDSCVNLYVPKDLICSLSSPELCECLVLTLH